MPGFDPSAANVDKAALEQVFLTAVQFSFVNINPPMIHTYWAIIDVIGN